MTAEAPRMPKAEKNRAQTKSVFTARRDPWGCVLRSMKAALQRTPADGHRSAGLAGESWRLVLLALTQAAAVLSLLSGARGSGNVDILVESLGTGLSPWMRFPYVM